jgi:hypothetical protein
MQRSSKYLKKEKDRKKKGWINKQSYSSVYLVHRTNANVSSVLIFIMNMLHDMVQSFLPQFVSWPMRHNWFDKFMEGGP